MNSAGHRVPVLEAPSTIPRRRFRYLVRELARDEPECDVFRTSFGLCDQEALSDRAATRLAARFRLSEEQLYERLLWRHLVELVLLRIPPERRERVKAELAIESDEALALRVVHDLMREQGLSPERVHDTLLDRTLRQRAPGAVRSLLERAGVADEEVEEFLARAGYGTPEALAAAVGDAADEIAAAPEVARARALREADMPSGSELACLLVTLAVRGGCGDAGARRAVEWARRIRRFLQGEPAQPAASSTR